MVALHQQTRRRTTAATAMIVCKDLKRKPDCTPQRVSMCNVIHKIRVRKRCWRQVRTQKQSKHNQILSHTVQNDQTIEPDDDDDLVPSAVWTDRCMRRARYGEYISSLDVQKNDDLMDRVVLLATAPITGDQQLTAR